MPYTLSVYYFKSIYYTECLFYFGHIPFVAHGHNFCTTYKNNTKQKPFGLQVCGLKQGNSMCVHNSSIFWKTQNNAYIDKTLQSLWFTKFTAVRAQLQLKRVIFHVSGHLESNKEHLYDIWLTLVGMSCSDGCKNLLVYRVLFFYPCKKYLVFSKKLGLISRVDILYMHLQSYA